MEIKLMNVDNKDKAKEFNMHFKKGKWVVLYHAEWCGHCKNFMPEWIKFQHNNGCGVKCAAVESAVMDELEKKPTIEGFPTIKLYDNTQEIGQYEGERTAQALTSYVSNILQQRDNTIPYFSKKSKAKKKTKSAAKSRKQTAKTRKARKMRGGSSCGKDFA